VAQVGDTVALVLEIQLEIARMDEPVAGRGTGSGASYAGASFVFQTRARNPLDRWEIARHLKSESVGCEETPALADRYLKEDYATTLWSLTIVDLFPVRLVRAVSAPGSRRWLQLSATEGGY